MLRFLRNRLPGHHEAKKAEKDEYFELEKTLHHGFPTNACCMAHDPQLNLLAIGTKSGDLRIYGAPGVEFSAVHPDKKAVKRIFFIPNQGRVITQCDDQTFHLWEINETADGGVACLEHVNAVGTDDRLKIISATHLHTQKDDNQTSSVQHRVLIGTESGNVYEMAVDTLELKDYIIYQDTIVQGVPDEHKATAGAVECMAIAGNKLLIGFTRGLIVLWDCATNAMVHAYSAGQGVESIDWYSNAGTKFVSSHNDGSYVEWSSDEASKPLKSPNIPFGPFPCKPIDRVFWKSMSSSSDDDLLLFSGGMPRASFGDRYTVSVQRKDKQLVFDLATKVLDVCTLDANINDEANDAHTLLVLCEEELVAIDLLDADWPMFRLPYLWPLHASPITACQYVTDVGDSVMDALQMAGREQEPYQPRFDPKAKSGADGWNKTEEEIAEGPNCHFKCTKREWPIQGGKVLKAREHCVDVLVTGHEDGNVRFWTADQVCMQLLCTVNCARLFEGYNNPSDTGADDDDWPPFRRVGQYDPYSDDQRYGVQRVIFDSQTGQLAVGANGGQVVICALKSEPVEISELKCIDVDVVQDRENFPWKGESRLQVRQDAMSFECGFVPSMVVQIDPPAAITALAMNVGWNMLAVGIGYGFAVIDTNECVSIFSQCLLNAGDMAAHNQSAFNATMTRFKSFKKSLRDSIRRRRRHAANRTGTPQEQTPRSGATSPATGEGAAAAAAGGSATASPSKSPAKRQLPREDDDDVAPVERAIEARGSQPEAFTSLIRCLLFAETYVTSGTEPCRSLWVGTNGGAIRIHVIGDVSQTSAQQQQQQESTTSAPQAPEASQPEQAAATASETQEAAAADDTIEPAATEPPVAAETTPTTNGRCQLAKEIQLQHGAPVLAMCIVNEHDCLIDCEQTHTTEHTQPTSHRVIVASEEQVKSFHLPSLKPGRHKFKMTALEGSRMRKSAFATLTSRTDEAKHESFLIMMTNQGEVQSFSLHNFRRYLKADCVDPGDTHSILSTVLSTRGEGLSLKAKGCEWQRFTVTPCAAVRAQCSLELPEGMRPVKAKTDEPTTEQAEQEEPATTLVATIGEQIEKTVEENVASTDLGQGDTSANLSTTMPTDITVDSIRDYTQQAVTQITDGVKDAVEAASDAVNECVTTVNTSITEVGDKVVVETKKITKTVTSSLTQNGEHAVETVTTSEVTNGVAENGEHTAAAAVVAVEGGDMVNGNTADALNAVVEAMDDAHGGMEDEISKLKEEVKEKMKVEATGDAALPTQ